MRGGLLGRNNVRVQPQLAEGTLPYKSLPLGCRSQNRPRRECGLIHALGILSHRCARSEEWLGQASKASLCP